MLLSLSAVLLVLWLASMAMSSDLGGFAHLFLLAALAAILLRAWRGGTPV